MIEDRGQASLAVLLIGAVVLSLILSIAPHAAAQVLYGTLTGNITDPSGAPIPGAKVEASNTETGAVHTARTSTSGLYSFTTLQPGSYKVTISAPNFATMTETGIVVNVNTAGSFSRPTC